jgi:ADP-ribose pyrophosphatase YjhB (NUDIX family)
MSAIVLYHRDANDFFRSEVLIIREFRSPARSMDGFVHGLPGGSKSEPSLSAKDVAVAELCEETGLRLGHDRLREVAVRQPEATVSVHETHLFAVELSSSELEMVREKEKAGKSFGEDGEERTTIEIWTLGNLLRSPKVDWSTLGMVVAALEEPRSA